MEKHSLVTYRFAVPEDGIEHEAEYHHENEHAHQQDQGVQIVDLLCNWRGGRLQIEVEFRVGRSNHEA